jgi:5-hydroxyisourate hydrolase-like protein (transthyretin family)
VAAEKKNNAKSQGRSGTTRRSRSGQSSEKATGAEATKSYQPTTGSVVGDVVDQESETGLADVRVVLGPAGGGKPLLLAETNDHGKFTFPEVDPGDYTVELDEVPVVLADKPWRPPPGDDGSRPVTVVAGEKSSIDPIRLEQILGAVTGFVLDLDAGTGLEAVSVALAPVDPEDAAATFRFTDDDGRFLFEAVAPGQYVVRLQPVPNGFQFRAPGVNLRPVAIDADEVEVVSPFLLQPVSATGAIEGSVRNAEDAGAVEGIEIALEPVEGGEPELVTTDSNGDFSKTGLAPGDYRVTLAQVPAEAAGQFWRPRPPDVGERNATVQPGKTVVVAPILLELLPVAAELTGQVLDVTTGSGMQGVQVALRATGAGAAPRLAETDEDGRFTFDGVAAGTYEVAPAQDPVPVNGEPFEPVVADPNEGKRTVVVSTAEPVSVPPILLEPERHRIFGKVQTRPGGPGAAFAKVQVFDERGNRIATVEADRNGDYEFRTGKPGRFLLTAEGGDGRFRAVELESDEPVDLFTVDETGEGAAVPTQDFAAFPVLTEAVTPAQLPAPSGGPVSSVGQTVTAALREALGWRPRPGDPRGFTAALAQSFDRREVEGHTVASWTPRTYAAQVQADLGAITGAQASLYSRARVALDEALPLLDGLYPLDPAADPQDTDAIRSIIRSELTDLVAELGVEGGPRVSRVDDLLDLLLGGTLQGRAITTAQDPIRGQLQQLQDRLGLRQDRVQTVAEEEDLTNFLILVDYVREIDTSWRDRRGFFDPTTGTPFLGTQLVLLSRSLAVTAESVTEVGFTLDSVFLGAAERLAIRLTFPATDTDLEDSRNQTITVPGGTPSILLGELLSWVERVASEEGPRLLQDGGKDGATALTPVLNRLRILVRASLVTTGSGTNQGLQSPDSLPAGYVTARVQRALVELAKYLDDTFDLASRIQRVEVSKR